MRQVITTYFIVVGLLALGFFGVGALAKAAELSDPMQPPALDNFSVEVQCGATTHTEGVTTLTTYQLTAIARSGVFGSLDYVQRRIQATVSLDPP